MARVLVDLVALLLVEIERHAPWLRVRDCIVHRELVAQALRVDALEAFGQLQLVAVNGPVAVAAEPRAVREIRRLDHERVALEVTARHTEPQPHVRPGPRTIVERYHARFVDHLVADHDVARRLHDLRAVAVDHGQDRARRPARDAAVVVREIPVRRGETPRASRPSLGQPLLAGRRQSRQPTVRRVHHHRCRMRRRFRPLEPVTRRVDRRRILGRELALGQRILVLRDLLVVGVDAGGVLLVRELCPRAELRGALERHADRVVARVGAAQIGIAPWRARRIGGECRGCEQCARHAHDRRDTHRHPLVDQRPSPSRA